MKKRLVVSPIREILWQTLHMPFHISVVMIGACISNLFGRIYPSKLPFDIKEYPVPTGTEPLEASLRLTFTVSVSICLVFTCFFVLLHKRVPRRRTLFPLPTILGFRALIALCILFVGCFGTSLDAFFLLITVTCLLLVNLAFSVIGLQTVGLPSLRDTACHFRLGSR